MGGQPRKHRPQRTLADTLPLALDYYEAYRGLPLSAKPQSFQAWLHVIDKALYQWFLNHKSWHVIAESYAVLALPSSEPIEARLQALLPDPPPLPPPVDPVQQLANYLWHCWQRYQTLSASELAFRSWLNQKTYYRRLLRRLGLELTPVDLLPHITDDAVREVLFEVLTTRGSQSELEDFEPEGDLIEMFNRAACDPASSFDEHPYQEFDQEDEEAGIADSRWRWRQVEEAAGFDMRYVADFNDAWLAGTSYDDDQATIGVGEKLVEDVVHEPLDVSGLLRRPRRDESLPPRGVGKQAFDIADKAYEVRQCYQKYLLLSPEERGRTSFRGWLEEYYHTLYQWVFRNDAWFAITKIYPELYDAVQARRRLSERDPEIWNNLLEKDGIQILMLHQAYCLLSSDEQAAISFRGWLCKYHERIYNRVFGRDAWSEIAQLHPELTDALKSVRQSTETSVIDRPVRRRLAR